MATVRILVIPPLVLLLLLPLLLDASATADRGAATAAPAVLCSSLDGPFCPPVNGRAVPSRLLGLQGKAPSPAPSSLQLSQAHQHPTPAPSAATSEEDAAVQASMREALVAVLGEEGADSPLAEALQHALEQAAMEEAASKRQRQRHEQQQAASASASSSSAAAGKGAAPLVARAVLRNKASPGQPDDDKEIVTVVELGGRQGKPPTAAKAASAHSAAAAAAAAAATAAAATVFRFDLGGGTVVDVEMTEELRVAETDRAALVAAVHRALVHAVGARQPVDPAASLRLRAGVERLVGSAFADGGAGGVVLDEETEEHGAGEDGDDEWE